MKIYEKKNAVINKTRISLSSKGATKTTATKTTASTNASESDSISQF